MSLENPSNPPQTPSNYTDYNDAHVRNTPLRLTDTNVNSKEFLGLYEVGKMESPCLVIFFNKFPTETFLNMLKNIVEIEPNNSPKKEFNIPVYLVAIESLRNGEIGKIGRIRGVLDSYYSLTEFLKGQTLGMVERLENGTSRLLDYNNYITEMQL